MAVPRRLGAGRFVTASEIELQKEKILEREKGFQGLVLTT